MAAKRSFRIAFVTPGFVTERNNASGLGNYINKMAQALVRAGHVPEIFVSSFSGPDRLDHNGVCVHRVHPRPAGGWLSWCPMPPGWRGLGQLRYVMQRRSAMITLAAALEARDREAPFDLVQSPDTDGTGLEIQPREGRPHLVRCSIMAELNAVEEARRRPWFPGFQSRYILRTVRRAEIAYAPSQFGANYYEKRLGRRVHVIRPPALIEIPEEVAPVAGVPERYLLHFGTLNPSKGTLWLAEALGLAWQREPEIKVVVAGDIHNIDTEGMRRRWGERARNVIFLGPLRKPQLYTLLRGALASLAPSIIDNLPNTVIESLLLGIPVIGTRGASIDELVEDGRTGDLVALRDAPALAEAMVRVWRDESPARRGFRWDGPVAREMQPETAVGNLLKLAGLIPGESLPN
ncbi:MAG: glycosyltransferase family 4 protein [Tepidisphaeraceae bacterium]